MLRPGRRARCGLLLVLWLGMLAHSQAVTVDVQVLDSGFSPDPVVITHGDTVRWISGGAQGHILYSGAHHLWDGTWSSSMPAGTTTRFARTFDRAGTFPYFCSIHENYSVCCHHGTVIVGAGNDQPPTVAITSPVAGAAFDLGTPVTLTVEASDSDGTVESVGFFDGPALVGLSTNRPFSLPIGPGAGTHLLTAVAADNIGVTATSAVVSVTVNRAASTGTLSSSANPALPGVPVAWVFQVSAVLSASVVPTGTVRFKVDGTYLDGPVSLTGGSAACAPVTLSHGRHVVDAEYGGDANFIGTTNTLSLVQLINRPPVAGTAVIWRSPAGGTKVLVSTLLSNASDPDGDPLQLVSTSGGTNGGTVSRSGDWIFYSPAPGATNQDSFACTIADNYGAQASGTVLVLVGVDVVPAANLQILELANGSRLLRFDGIPSATYRVEYSGSLNVPSWQPLGSGTADPFGAFRYVDTPPSGAAQRFYRAISP